MARSSGREDRRAGLCPVEQSAGAGQAGVVERLAAGVAWA